MTTDPSGAGVAAEAAEGSAVDPAEQPGTRVRDATIQFAPAVKPAPKESGRVDDDERIRRQSVVSIPHVISEQEKDRREFEKNLESKHVKIDEHLLRPEVVAARYKTRIDTAAPSASLGLTTPQAAHLLAELGANVLTPPKKRHPFLKFLDSLRSLFNLLLILAGILEYILLGIDYKNNFQNVRH
jgi:sodium/potassium-transporting ATPase subunit alpha